MYADSEGRTGSGLSKRTIGLLALTMLIALCMCLLMTGTGESDAADGDVFTEINDYTVVSENDKTVRLTQLKTVFESTDTVKEYTVPLTVTHNGTEYRITGIDAKAFRNSDVLSLKIPDGTSIDTLRKDTFSGSRIAYVTLGSGVIYLEPGTFRNCSSINTITFGPTIYQITAAIVEDYVGNEGLSHISVKNFVVTSHQYYSSKDGVLFDRDQSTLILFPSGRPYESGNKEIGFKYNDYIVPDTVTRIGHSAFAGADLRFVSIGAGVENIDKTAFANAFVKEFRVDATNQTYSSPDNMLVDKVSKTFMRCAVGKDVQEEDQLGKSEYTVPSGIITIEDYAFMHALGYNKIILPESTATIGYNSFRDCRELTSMDLSHVISVGHHAFLNCGKMVAEVPVTVKSIGAGAFENSGITSVTISKELNLGALPFKNCASIVSFTVEDGHPGLKSVNGVVYTAASTELVFYPAGSPDLEFTVPDSVETIAPYAFAKADGLSKIVLGTNLLNISDYAFGNCKLNEVVFNKKLSTVGNHAFDNAINFKEVTFPDSVVHIGDFVFGFGYMPRVLNIGSQVTYIGEMEIGEKGLTLNIAPENPKYMIVTGEYGMMSLGIKQYTVTFRDNTEIVKQEKMDYGTLVIAPEYSKPGFTKWKDFEEGRTYVRGDIEFAALYDNREYSITGLDGYVTVDRTAKAGTIILVNISCPAGKTIADLKYNGLPMETVRENQYKFVMPAQDVILSGNVSDVKYRINADPDYFERSHDTAKYGEQVSVTFKNEIPAGKRLTVINLPADATASEDGRTFSFSMPAYDVNIAFELNSQSYNIINDMPFQVSAPSTAMYNQTVTVTVNPPAGKIEDAVTVDGVQIESKGAHTYEFTMPAHDVTLSVTFKPNIHSAKVICGEHGTASLSHETDIVAGTMVTLVITPDENYMIGSIGCTDLELTIAEKQTFFMPSHDVEIQVLFSGKSFGIHSGPGVIVDGSAEFGNTVTVDIDNPGKELTGIRADGVEFTEVEKGVSYTFVMPGHAVDIIASFKTVFDSGSGVKEGDTLSFTAEDCDQAVVPFEDAKSASDNVKVNLINGSLMMDRTALSNVTGASQSVTIAISSDSGLSPEIREMIEGRRVYEVSVGDVHDFGNGRLTVTLKYALGTGEEPELLTVWHFVDSESVERLPCTYDADRGEITFQVSSLSRFAVMENKFDVTVECNEGGTVTASPSEGVTEGTVITVTVTPQEGYYVTAIHGIGGIGPDGEEALNKLLVVGGTATFKMGDQDLEVRVAFAATEPEPPSGGDDKGGSNMGLYIGAAVAVLAVIAIAFFVMKRRA